MAGAVKDGDDLVKLSNELLSQLNLQRRVRRVEDVDSSLFVVLYEGLCGEKIPDIIRKPKSKEDDVHNCQCVIDSLAMDVLHTSLSHITSEDIVSHNTTAIYNLLEIFSGLMEFILHKIEKECSSENDDRPASTDSSDHGLISKGPRSDEEKSSPSSAIAAGIQRVFDDKQMQSPERKRPRVEKDSSFKGSTRRLRKTPQPLLRPLASSSMQSIVIPSSSDTNYETDSTSGLVSDRDSKSNTSQKHRGRVAVQFDLPEIEHTKSNYEKEATLKQQPDSSGARGNAHGETEFHRPPGARAVNGEGQTFKLPSIDVHAKAAVTRSDLRSQAKKDKPHGDDHPVGVSKKALLAAELATHILKTGESTAELIELANTTFTKERSSAPPAPSMTSAAQQPLPAGYIPPLTFSMLTGPADVASTGSISQPATGGAGPNMVVSAASSAAHEQSLRPARSASAPHPAAPGIAEDFEVGQRSRSKRACIRNPKATIDQQPMSAMLSASLTPGGAASLQHRGGESAAQECVHANDVEQTQSHSSGLVTNDPHFLSRDFTTACDQATHPLRSVSKSTGLTQPTENNECVEQPVEHASHELTPMLRTRRHVSFLKDRSKSDNSINDKSSVQKNVESPLWQELRDYVSSQTASTAVGHADSAEPDAYGATATAGSASVWRGDAADQPGKPKKVRFDQQPQSALQTAVSNLQRTLGAEATLDARRKLVLGKLYQNGFEEIADEYRHVAKDEKRMADRREAAYRRQLRSMSSLGTINTNRPRKDENTRPKGYLLPRERIIRQLAKSDGQGAAGSEPPHATDRRHQLDPEDDNFIPALLDEFPNVDVAPETIRDMWRKHWLQAKLASKAAAEVRRKKSQAQAQMEEAERKQRLLMHIMKKDITLGQRMRQRKIQEKAAKQARQELEERRLQTARVRRYYDEYAVQTRSKMLRSRTREEQIFKDLFRKGLEIQKHRIRELRDYAKEKRQARAAEQQQQIEALENYYEDQFNMLAESASKEHQEWQLREQAQAAVLNKIKKEMRQRMEKEIEHFQNQLLQDEDDSHFRQLDADRIQLQLKLTRLQTGV